VHPVEAHSDAIPAVSVAAYTLKGRDPHARSIRAAASSVITSEEHITARGEIRRRPASWLPGEHARHGRIGDQVLGLPGVQAGDDLGQRLRASKRRTGTKALSTLIPTRAD
jgi:hypothetical protein